MTEIEIIRSQFEVTLFKLRFTKKKYHSIMIRKVIF